MTIASAIQRNLAIAPQVSDTLRRVGRVHIPAFLEAEEATALLKACEQADWRVVFNGEGRTYDVTGERMAALDPGQRAAVLDTLHATAAQGFQFLFDSYRISDEAEAGRLTTGVLADFFTALNSAPVLEGLRRITGDDRIVYADAQATRYRPGHFLCEHNDAIEGKHRLFAYVLNLSPAWRTDWGGLLQFLDSEGHVAEAYAPRWGALNILRVPQPHAVTYVAPFAQAARYSITGWLRAQKPEPGA